MHVLGLLNVHSYNTGGSLGFNIHNVSLPAVHACTHNVCSMTIEQCSIAILTRGSGVPDNISLSQIGSIRIKDPELGRKHVEYN